MKTAHPLAVTIVAALVIGAGCGGSSTEQDSLPANNASSELRDPGATTLPPLNVEFVVYDGTTQPFVIAGCSEPTCLGAADGSDPTPGTGTVTHQKNNVGWMVAGGTMKGSIYLYVDGQKVASARSTKLLVWSATPGTHELKTLAYNADGVASWSPAVTITAQ